uniref:Uncharacterized protein n=1 Tax=Anguilla anguilla TaxID=7936 RepID=A0A0E9WDP5_ANGAN
MMCKVLSPGYKSKGCVIHRVKCFQGCIRSLHINNIPIIQQGKKGTTNSFLA